MDEHERTARFFFWALGLWIVLLFVLVMLAPEKVRAQGDTQQHGDTLVNTRTVYPGDSVVLVGKILRAEDGRIYDVRLVIHAFPCFPHHDPGSQAGTIRYEILSPKQDNTPLLGRNK